MNSHAYRYEIINNKNGLFDDYIDMVYILTLEDSSRRQNYMNQINKYNIHKNIIIQHNKGYKNSKKQLYNQDTISDINDSFYHAFYHAKQNNYQNIIIFEDDFEFNDTINSNIVNNIGNFIKNNKFHIYHLGSIFHISYPTIYLGHLISVFITSAHGVIYNNKYIDYYINQYEKGMSIPNDQVWLDLKIIKYTYYKPLCFQVFGETKNRNNWKFKEIILKIFELVNLHKSHSPGYSIFNGVSYVISISIVLILIKLTIS
jgi:hypothetical protein